MRHSSMSGGSIPDRTILPSIGHQQTDHTVRYQRVEGGCPKSNKPTIALESFSELAKFITTISRSQVARIPHAIFSAEDLLPRMPSSDRSSLTGVRSGSILTRI